MSRQYRHLSERERVLLGFPARKAELQLSAWVILANLIDDSGERLTPGAGEELPTSPVVGAIARSAGFRGRRRRYAQRQDVAPNRVRKVAARSQGWAVS